MSKTAKNNNLKGVITALVTPFKKGRVDYPSLKRLVRFQLDGGVEGFVVNGTTGESPVLASDEVEKIFKFIRRESDGAVPLILGTGSNNTAETIKKTKLVKKLKAQAALVVVPYYNKPPQRALVAHFTAVAESTTSPILLYNVPGRTVVSTSDDTVTQLSKIKNIVGIKEASGRIEFIRTVKPKVKDNFLYLSGDDSTCIDFMLAGGHGVISVISHVIPRELRRLSDLARSGAVISSVEYKKFENLNRLLGVEANPIPVKMMLYLMGVIDSPELRLPLLALDGENKRSVENELLTLGLMR